MLGRLKPSCKHLWHLVSTTVSCNAVLAESPRVITDKLQRVMNPAARVVTNTRKYDSGLSRLMHDELHWLDVTDRVRFKRSCIDVSMELLRRTWWTVVYSQQKSLAVNICVLPLSGSWSYRVVDYRLNSFGRRRFSVAGPSTWNSPPDSLHNPEPCLDTFRR